MKTKLMWFNDRDVPVNVCVDSLHNSIEVKPHSFKSFIINLEEKQGVFIKEWDYNTVLISAIYDKEDNEKP